MRGEYIDAVYMYMANERIISKSSGVSEDRRKRLINNNKIIKSNVDEILGKNKFTELYTKLMNGEWRDIQYVFSIDVESSSGELAMEDELTRLNIPYIREVTFDELPYARYDFFLPSKNTVIEIDGIQHFEFTPEYHKTINDLKIQKTKDNVKRRFAYKKNIIYIRFKYNELGDIVSKLEKNFKL